MRGSLFSLAGGLPGGVAKWAHLFSTSPLPSSCPRLLLSTALLGVTPRSGPGLLSLCSFLLSFTGWFIFHPTPPWHSQRLYFWPSFRKAWETASWSERRESSGQRRRGGRYRGKHANVQIATQSCPERSHSLRTALCRDGFLWRSCPQLPLSVNI